MRKVIPGVMSLWLVLTSCAAPPPGRAIPSSSVGVSALATLHGPPGAGSATTSPSAPAVSTRLTGPIQRLDADIGFATTESGLIRTLDAGRTWTALGRMSGAFFSELRMTDVLHGWAIVQRWAPDTICLGPKTAPPCWVVVSTDDGGASWKDRLAVAGNQLGTATLTSLQAIDDKQSWVVAQCPAPTCPVELRATTDGGATWTTRFSKSLGLGPVRFASAARGWIAAARPEDKGGTDIYATSDGGVTWSFSLTVADPVIAIDAASEREAWVLARNGAYCTSSSCSRYDLIRTVDGGATWAGLGNPKDRATCSGGHLSGPLFASPMLGWFGISLGPGGANVGDGGLMRTTDGGRSWDCRAIPRNVRYVSAADPLRIWVRSDPSPANDTKASMPILMSTEDGGETWRPLEIVLR